MNKEQVAAAAALGRALRKVRDAELTLRVYDGTVYVAPLDTLGDDGYEACLEHGERIDVAGLNADGGAGT